MFYYFFNEYVEIIKSLCYNVRCDGFVAGFCAQNFAYNYDFTIYFILEETL